MGRFGSGLPLLTAKSCKFSLFWVYISQFLPNSTLSPLFLQILGPALAESSKSERLDLKIDLSDLNPTPQNLNHCQFLTQFSAFKEIKSWLIKEEYYMHHSAVLSGKILQLNCYPESFGSYYSWCNYQMSFTMVYPNTKIVKSSVG